MMKGIMNRHAKIIMIKGGEVKHRNDNNTVPILEATHDLVTNAHVTDNTMRLRRTEGGVLAHFHKVQVPLRRGIRQRGLLLEPQHGGLTVISNERHQRILIRKETFTELCICG